MERHFVDLNAEQVSALLEADTLPFFGRSQGIVWSDLLKSMRVTIILCVLIVLVPAAIVGAIFRGATEPSDADNSPDYRIMLGDADDAVEVGAGWKRVGEKAGNYVSLAIDDPSLIQPIHANLFQSGSDPDAHILLWNRPSKRKQRD